ncbi:Cwf15/Cwc15 cell cycle control protein [Diaporthe helianthi]|uniref:Cwf15/Cwc15 cell cycle control protein n=1 Tax=Diaporthe helianthi TaxID=158607 RepID=A0A2P5HMQ8_DIAHE|nr:Cwf15/Cwc15 cell cycle control protein [Diaporthe helianthi]
MTTAHRPTFDPARGKDTLRGPGYHQRLLPAHTQLKFRKPGQGGDADRETRDLRAELLAAEQAHHAKLNGGALPPSKNEDDGSEPTPASRSAKRALEAGSTAADDDEDPEAKRRRIIEETRDIDADDSDSSSSEKDDDDDDDSSDSDSDSDDEEAELQRELERVRRERQEKREREEREKAAAEAEEREREIARGNPLLNNNNGGVGGVKTDFTVKRRWDDDVVFKNQARGTEDKNKTKEFVNDLLRSDFHKRFMSKYVR